MSAPSIGTAMKYCKAALWDEHSDTVHHAAPTKTIGELCVRGANIYTIGARTTADFMHTGDLVYRNNSGDYFFAGRINDVIVRGVEKILPQEVEDALRTHPHIGDVLWECLIKSGMKKSQLLLFQISQVKLWNIQSSTSFLRSLIATFRIPRRIVYVAALSLGKSGKPDRISARKLFM